MISNTCKILVFSDDADALLIIKNRCSERGVQPDIVHSSANHTSVSNAIAKLDADERLMIITKPRQVLFMSPIHGLEKFYEKGSVIFGAAATFRFQNAHLRYFYWKHYPRTRGYYNYLDAAIFYGYAGDIRNLLASCAAVYPDAERQALSDVFHRYFVDSALGSFLHATKLKLDYNRHLIAAARVSARRRAGGSWMYEFLYGLNEREIYKSAGMEDALQYPMNTDLPEEKQLHHTGSKPNPAIVALDNPLPVAPKPSPLGLKLRTSFTTVQQLFTINRINKCCNEPEQIFRFAKNKSEALTAATERIVSRLEQKLPLSFAHYNDGELTFIKDFLSGNHTAKWFGRRQQQYDPILAQRLLAAMKFKKEGYFVGVPCSRDHHELSVLADELVGTYDFKVPAMAIHHNLSYLPRILHALKDRNLFFFTNEFQNLAFFHHFGLSVPENQVYKVPFRNSYLEYDRFHNMHFPDNAVVLMTCGMLAKILVHPWYQNHDKLTVLAFGSCLDDHIQKENSNFELYPKEFPLTKNLHQSRAFLFGYKRRCPECFDF